MSALTAARTALSAALDAALGDDVLVFAIIPEKVTPPFVAVAPGDPYVEYEGAVFGGKRVRLAASCVVAAGTNDLQADALDTLIETVANAVDATGTFVVESVQQPGHLVINNQAHLGASVIVLTEV